MSVQNASAIRIAYKVQSVLGTAVDGTGASGLEVTGGAGLSMQRASIESRLIPRSRMRKRPRQGSQTVSAAYDTELMVGAVDPAFEATLGGTWAAALSLDETDLTTATISASGATITFGASAITAGLRVGMMARFANMSEAANNGVWFPVLDISTNGLVVTTDPAFLVDNASDSDFDLTVARSLATTSAGYVDRLFTVEEYGVDIDRSKLGVDMRFNSMAIAQTPDNPATVSFGMGGRSLSYLGTGVSPNFTDAVYNDGQPLVLLDGGVYVNGTKRLDMTGFRFGLEAPIQTVPLIVSKVSPDIFVGTFALSGEFTGVVQNADDFDAFDDEDRISVLLNFVEAEDPGAFTTFYLGNLSYGGYTSPAGGDGALIATIPLLGGRDERGGQYAETAVLISTSHTPA